MEQGGGPMRNGEWSMVTERTAESGQEAPSAAVRDNVEQSRFELEVDGALAVIEYRREGALVSFNHAEVPSQCEGRGLGARLVRGALELTRARGERVVPRCAFVAAYLRRHPEFDDLRST